MLDERVKTAKKKGPSTSFKNHPNISSNFIWKYKKNKDLYKNIKINIYWLFTDLYNLCGYR